MNTVRKLLYNQILSAVLFVTVAFLALFYFFDLVEELSRLGPTYRLGDALWVAALAMPQHLYDVFPITLLIGSILALSRLAQSSEFTILRTAGLGPGRALAALGALGVVAALLLVLLGDWVTPWAQQQGVLYKAHLSQGQALALGRGGAWLRQSGGLDSEPDHQLTLNVGAALGDQRFQGVRIFEFNAQGQLVRRLLAREAQVTTTGGAASAGASTTSPPVATDARLAERAHWTLLGVQDTRWTPPPTTTGAAAQVNPEREGPMPDTGATLVRQATLASLNWTSQMSPQVVAASVLPMDTMSTLALWRYTTHLERNAQAAQKYELYFWRKAFAPLACLVMVSLALPFAYLQTRSGGMALKVFGGIMLGISYVLANHISSHLGLLHQWQPWLAALLPSVGYTLLSMLAFVWLVRYR